MSFQVVDIKNPEFNPFQLINDEWMLITCGNEKGFNSMTASWGTLGIMCSKPVACCLIRPTRYTYGFMENSDYYTLSFYGENYRKELGFFGSKSGRDYDKAEKTGFTPVKAKCGAIYYEQAERVLVCKKIYSFDVEPKNMIDQSIDVNYPLKDYHRIYVGEILEMLEKE